VVRPERNCIVRITGGDWRGRRLGTMKGFKGRPTTDFAREGLCNLLRTRVELEGAVVLDLFAGTGIVGMECASRGAMSVTAVELDKRAVGYIKSTYKEFGFEKFVVVSTDVFKFLERSSMKCDFVFADPPYDLDRIREIPSEVKASGVLAEDGMFVLEHGESVSFEGDKGFVERRKYGHVNFSFFQF
jgi:16S rRNA (guanine966-N2)-methyltransferase